MALAFAGRYGHGVATGDPAEIEAALARDGPASSAAAGPLELAWTPRSQGLREDLVCLVDGRPDCGALARDLRLDPARPADELVAAAYARIGDTLVDRLSGEFALLVWDRAAGRGLLARDRSGARPLFFTARAGGVVFASEVWILLALLRSRPAPDAVAVAHWLARTSPRDHRTLYEGIRPLPAAHALVLEDGGAALRRYWKPVYRPPRAVSAEEAAAEVHAALGAAVARAVEGAAQPAVMLSGGLDSSAVAVLAQPRVRTAYSAVFPAHRHVDESDRLRRVRAHLGLDGTETAFAGGSAIGAAIEFIREWELPSASPNLFVWLPLMRRAADDGVDVLLDGEGGDELFGTAVFLLADRLRHGRAVAALQLSRQVPGMGARPRPRWIGRALARYGARGALPPRVHAGLRAARGRAPRLGDEWAWKATRAPRWWAQLADALTTTRDAIGARDQLRREGAMGGVELRHPLLATELVELMLALPPELGFDAHRDRPLARRALAADLPADVLADDRKPAFNSLLDDALAGPDRTTIEALLAAPHPELARRVDEVARKALVEHRSPTWSLDLWRVAQLELWLAHNEDPAALDRWRTYP
jgi:asparagine synthase (glutamine-hydrolysing)